LDFQVSRQSTREKIHHPGTFNANPLSAAAGVAALEIVGTTDACDRANRYAESLRRRVNEVFDEEKVPWAVYGTFSMFHVFTNPERAAIRPTAFDPLQQPAASLADKRQAGLVDKLRLAMIVNGVDLSGSPGGLVSATHEAAELDDTVRAFRDSLRMLRREAEI
jgi:glutamate-1-semialdehyde 2,1-aminomutase